MGCRDVLVTPGFFTESTLSTSVFVARSFIVFTFITTGRVASVVFSRITTFIFARVASRRRRRVTSVIIATVVIIVAAGRQIIRTASSVLPVGAFTVT